MTLFTIYLTVVSLTTPTLEELSQRTEPWVREDVTIRSVSEFHTSDFLREDERVLLLHHAFLDDENETLRTVVCTDTRVIVLEEGVVVREIELSVKPVLAVSSPSGRFFVVHGGSDTPEAVRAVRLDTTTGEQRFFNAMPSDNPRTGTWTWLQDDGSLVTRLGSHLWFFDTELNPVSELSVAPTGTRVSVARNADMVFITVHNLSAYNRRGDLLWTISDEYNPVRVHYASISDDGSLVGLAMRDGAFLFNGATGVFVADYFTTGDVIGDVGQIAISPSGNRFLVRRWDDRLIISSVCLETGEQYSFALGARVRAILDSGIALLDFIVLDPHLDPYYVPGRYIYTISSSGRRLVQASEWYDSTFTVHSIQSVLPTGFQIVELHLGSN